MDALEESTRKLRLCLQQQVISLLLVRICATVWRSSFLTRHRAPGTPPTLSAAARIYVCSAIPYAHRPIRPRVVCCKPNPSHASVLT